MVQRIGTGNPTPGKRPSLSKWVALTAIFVSIVFLSLADLMEIIPFLAPETNSFSFSIFREVHEVLALGLVLVVSYKCNPRLGIIAGLTYFAITLPLHIINGTDLMRMIHLIAVGLTSLLGIWLISRLRNSEGRYRSLFTNMSGGLAYCRMILDGDTAKDFEYLEVNDKFKEIIGLHNLVGKTGTEMISDVLETNPNFITLCSRVAKGGKTEQIEIFSPRLNEWYSATVYSPKQDHFVEVLDVITARKRAEEQLKQTFQDLEIAQRLTKIGNWKWALATGEVTWSKGLRLIFGWDPWTPPPTFEKMSVFYTPDSWKRLNEAVTNALKSGKSYDIEVEMIRTDGTIIVTNTRGEVDLDDFGNATGMHGTVQDITEARRTNEDLIRAKTELSKFFNLVPDMACMVSVDGYFKKINKAWAGVLGYAEEEILGKRYTEIMHPDDVKNISGQIKRQLAHSKTLNFVSRIRARSGEYRWFEWNASQAEDEIIYGAARDITAQKLNEETIRSSESRYRSLFEQAGDCIFVFETDKSGTLIIADANKVAAVTHGYSIEELIGKPVTFLDPYLSSALLKDRVDKLFSNKRIRFEATHKKKDGGLVILEVEGSLLEIGGKTFILSVEHDVTDSKRLEEERLRSDKLQSLGILAGGIAHDFNNVLASILTNLQITKIYVQRGDHENAFETLDEAEEASFKAKSLTQQLLTFSKGGTPVKRILHIGDLVKQSASFILSGSKSKPVFAIPEDIWAVEVDEGQISQVVNNIVLNADQAMPDGGIIDIKLSNVPKGRLNLAGISENNYIEVAIEDHGTGIPGSHFDKLFDPYFTTKQKGSGLGLATAYSIIKNHNGCINFKSELGSGTIFYVYLPALPARILKPRKLKPPAISKSLPGLRGRVLVMDDETILRNALGRVLQECGYEVELTSEGTTAVEKYRQAKTAGRRFDAVILDLTVPGGMGGRETIGKLLELDPDVKAIVSSGYANDSMMSDFHQFGFSGVVTKPYKISELKKLLGNIVKQKTSSRLGNLAVPEN